MNRSSRSAEPASSPRAVRITLSGRVQGLGVRPAIYRWARRWGLAGVVRNSSQGVEIEAEGAPDAVAAFLEQLLAQLPAGTSVEQCRTAPIEPRGRAGFHIERRPDEGPISARVPPDLAVCPECLAEIRDPAERRYRYPLTSCTACGPRYTIIRRMPYERSDTTMASFVFCPPCRAEYEGEQHRRLHAQTNACGDCGPRVWCAAADGRRQGEQDEAVRAAAAALRAGRIVALRGVGGYQLLADATNQAVVERLRRLKGRPAKPLAVLAASLADAERLAVLDDGERAALADRSNPIVLVRRRADSPLAPAISFQLDTVGLMLPTTPLHDLVVGDAGRPLVCTSGNRDGEPLEYEPESAQRRLAGRCDLFLHHDRPIARPIDDSVVRVIAGRWATVRLARGLAPLPLDLPGSPPVLALGGHLKAAAAWSNGRQAVLGPHVGDLDTLAARQRFVEQLDAWRALYRFEPEWVVHDLHPEYFTTRWAERAAERSLAVQHHHAHVAAGMLEHGWLDRDVLGAAWDGTGFGEDGAIWGGELLLGRPGRFRRAARLRPFPLPGGEAAIRAPWRVAAALTAEAAGVEESARLDWPGVDPRRRDAVLRLAASSRLSPRTSSIGRLFDAAAAVILGVSQAAFDGQAPMLLEAAVDPQASGAYDLVMRAPERTGEPAEWDWRPLWIQILEDRRRDAAPGTMAARFHRALARAVAAAARPWPGLPVVLGGGVFQNRWLTELVIEQLTAERRLVGPPGRIPANDGGLAAGQLAVAGAMIHVSGRAGESG